MQEVLESGSPLTGTLGFNMSSVGFGQVPKPQFVVGLAMSTPMQGLYEWISIKLLGK